MSTTPSRALRIRNVLGGSIIIRSAYSDNEAIEKDGKVIFVGTYQEINGFIAGIEYSNRH